MGQDKYQQHFLMDTKTVIEYVRDRLDYFPPDADLRAREIGDGNINYVFRVWDDKTGQSLVIKQADRVLRSSGRPLDPNRSRIEAEILSLQNQLCPGFVPQVYDYNENMFALAMEDISAYKNLRKELAEGKIFPNLARDISAFMVDSLINTTDLVMDRHKKKERVKAFINIDLCDISEDLVFTEPYYDYKGRNIITGGMEAFVHQKLYQDEDLKAQVGQLRNRFMNYAQALLHGDLHTGSIFIRPSGIKVIDPEFAFFGPMGYDIGNVIGNLYFAWANKVVNGLGDKDFIQWLDQTIIDIYDGVKDGLRQKMEEKIDLPLYNKQFQEDYLKSVLEDSLGYAGTEIIRRTVGDAKVGEITSVSDKDRRIGLEKILITFGVNMIKQRRSITCGKDLSCQFRKVVDLLWN